MGISVHSSFHADNFKVECFRKLTISVVVNDIVLCVAGTIIWFAFGGVVSQPPNDSEYIFLSTDDCVCVLN